jgi:hypothetical protein
MAERIAQRGESLLEQVQALAPRHLLLLAAGAGQATRLAGLSGCAERVSLRDAVAGLADLAGLDPADLAVLAAPAGGLLQPGLTQVLARLRDQLAGRVLVTSDEASPSGAVRRHLLSLGYQPLDGLPGCFGFDLASYNPPRDWNTPEHWAHPENFDRYRW